MSCSVDNLHRDIHCGYSQVDLEAQLSTDIHWWMMWISIAGYMYQPTREPVWETFQRLVHILFQNNKVHFPATQDQLGWFSLYQM
jgi:hypothetical protein